MKKLDNGIMSFPPRGSERRCVIAQIKPPRFLHFQKEMRVGLVCRLMHVFYKLLLLVQLVMCKHGGLIADMVTLDT